MESRLISQLSTSRRRLVWNGLLLLGLLVYAGQFLPWMGAYAGASDSSGYLNQARLIAAGEVARAPRVIEGAPLHADAPYLYVPLGFRPLSFAPAQMVPTYPTGLSLMVAGASAVVGWDNGAHVVMAAHLLAALIVVYALARVLALSGPWAALATATVALSPLTVFMGLHAMSDLPALVWVTLAVLLAELSRTRGVRYAIGAGAAFAVAVLVRPSNVLALAPVAIALGLEGRRWWWFGWGGLPGAIFFSAYTYAAYGSFLTTGYGDVSGAFKLHLLGPTLQHYLWWLPILLTPMLLFVLAAPLGFRGRGRSAALLGSWAALMLGFYAFYDHTHETWWYLRFVLPAFPALALAATIGAAALPLWRRWTLRRKAAAWVAALVAVLVFSASWRDRLHARYAGQQEAIYPELCQWAKQHLPANAIVVGMQVTGALLYYTDFTFVRWDHATPSEVARVEAAAAAADRPLYAILFEFEEANALAHWRPESWTKVQQIHHVSIWRRQAD